MIFLYYTICCDIIGYPKIERILGEIENRIGKHFCQTTLQTRIHDSYAQNSRPVYLITSVRFNRVNRVRANFDHLIYL